MSKLKININKPDPSSESIKKHKNYDGFLKQYQELHTPNGIYRMWKKDPVKMSMIIVFISLLLIFLLSDWEKKPQPAKKPAQKIEMNKWVCFFRC